MTTTARKIRFTAVSPFTGQVYTRQSARAYGFACIAYEAPESVARRAEQIAVADHQYATRYEEAAHHLRTGTTPAPGSALLRRASGTSLREQDAGVRTEWDAVLYRLRERHQGDAQAMAAEYDAYAAKARANQARHLAYASQVRDAGEYQEGATFHHTEALALAATRKYATYPGTYQTAVVAATA